MSEEQGLPLFSPPPDCLKRRLYFKGPFNVPDRPDGLVWPGRLLTHWRHADWSRLLGGQSPEALPAATTAWFLKILFISILSRFLCLLRTGQAQQITPAQNICEKLLNFPPIFFPSPCPYMGSVGSRSFLWISHCTLHKCQHYNVEEIHIFKFFNSNNGGLSILSFL